MQEKMLIVDDDELCLKIMEELLRTRGGQIDCCCDGGEAIELAVKDKYDIIFVDYIMPEIDGYEVMKAIRSGGASSTSVIILLTGSREIETDTYYGNRGFDDYLYKPINVEIVGKVIDAALLKRKDYEKGAAKEPDFLQFLENNDFDTSEGLRFAHNCPEFYQEILSVYSARVEGTICKLRQYKGMSLEEYEGFVSDKKEDAKNIGANKLFNRLFKHMIAATIGDREWIEGDFENLIEIWQKTSTVANTAADM